MSEDLKATVWLREGETAVLRGADGSTHERPYLDGVLTADHSASSYGLPVLLVGKERRPVGPAEFARLYHSMTVYGSGDMVDRARAAGYTFDARS